MVPCGWEGNHRSGVTLTIASQTLVVLHIRAQGLGEGDELPPMLSSELYLYLYHRWPHSEMVWYGILEFNVPLDTVYSRSFRRRATKVFFLVLDIFLQQYPSLLCNPR